MEDQANKPITFITGEAETPQQGPQDLNALGKDVEINIGGSVYTLRYTMGTLRKLKKTLGRSMMGVRGSLLDLDEEMLPKLIIAGAYDESGKTSLTEQDIDDLPSAAFTALVTAFNQAWFGSMPKKSLDDPTVKAALEKMMNRATT